MKHVAVASLSLAALLAICAPQVAEAHFILQEPAAWMSQDSLGAPEKLGPCGDESDGTSAATPTNIVTAVQEGSKITVTIQEVIFHPGHYRIAIADRANLPAEPPVTAASTPCGSVPVESPPVFPVLADGVFEHTMAFTSPQTVEVTLPAGFSCTKCTLQVIEFMSDHGLNVPGGCFYHHCADFSVQSSIDGSAGGSSGSSGGGSSGGSGGSSGGGSSGGSGGSSGGSSGGPDASVEDASGVAPGDATTGGAAASKSSGGCSVIAGPSSEGWGTWGTLAAAAAVLIRRRKRERREP